MMNTSCFLMNHGFMFDHSEGLALTSWDKDTLSPFVVSKDYEVLWQAFANVFGRNPSHVFRDVVKAL